MKERDVTKRKLSATYRLVRVYLAHEVDVAVVLLAGQSGRRGRMVGTPLDGEQAEILARVLEKRRVHVDSGNGANFLLEKRGKKTHQQMSNHQLHRSVIN